MDHTNKIVTQIPIKSLWTDNEYILACRGRYLTSDNIKEALKRQTVRFVVAEVGKNLEWISCEKSFEFWKTDLFAHLAIDINNINCDSFPGSYAYVASEWTGEIQSPIILLEKYH